MKTRQGWVGKDEVVQVWYDPKVISLPQLSTHAELRTAKTMRLDAQQKYYLLQSPLQELNLSEAQACRVNASLQGDWKQFLSPSQRLQADHLLKPKK